MEVCFVYRCNFKSPFRTRKEMEVWYLLRSPTLIFSALTRCLGERLSSSRFYLGL